VLLNTPTGPLIVGAREGIIFVTVDLAASIKTYADYTAIGVWQWANNCLILRHLVRDRLEAPDQLLALNEVQTLWRPAFIAIERTGYQLAAIQNARHDGLTVTELTPDKDKFSRAVSFAAKAVSHQVYFPLHAPWKEQLLAELCAFPNAANDDQVDICSYAADETIDLSRSARLIPIVGV
jgi:predicted phage terminase large subunit-like protein